MSPPAVQGQGAINILVVDDNDFTRRIVLRVLKDLGFSCITDADNTKSALKLLKDNKFDLIITDIHMPGVNGLEFAQLIRTGKTHAKPDTRIVVLTSFSQTEVLGIALALDINGFLVKPIIPSVADEKIAQAMSEQIRLHPPLAYEAIKTELRSLPNSGNRLPNTCMEGTVTLAGQDVCNSDRNESLPQSTIRSLRPGMMLKEDIHLSDGTLLMSSGHVFSELSINRLNDLGNLLTKNSIAAQEVSEVS